VQIEPHLSLSSWTKGLSTPGNKLLPVFRQLLPETATICRKRQQTVARNGNIVAAPESRRFWQQFVAVFGNFVAWCGQALMGIG